MSRPQAASACEWSWLGMIDYTDAWDLQRNLALKRALGEIPDTLLLLEHPPVYTTGRRDTTSSLCLPESMLGAPLIETDRGGDITFHGPGQLVAYPMVDLKAAGLSVVDYVRELEQTVIETLAEYGIEAGVICGLTGVWVEEEKIAAIGVRVSRPAGGAGAWVTSHGLALNVDVDLSWFERIVPCGISDKGVTSMQALIGTAPPVLDVAETLAAAFGRVFQRTMIVTEVLNFRGSAAPSISKR